MSRKGRQADNRPPEEETRAIVACQAGGKVTAAVANERVAFGSRAVDGVAGVDIDPCPGQQDSRLERRDNKTLVNAFWIRRVVARAP